jgi:hypothetical protein
MECNGINMTPNGQSTLIDGQSKSNWGLWEWWEWDYLIGAVVTSQYPVE